MKARRIAVLLFISVFLFTFSFMYLPAPALAGDAALNKAIKTVRQTFDIPADFTEFSSSYQSANNQSVLCLTWSSPDETGGNFTAQVDTVSGEIIGMSQYIPALGSAKPKLPAMTVKEAQNLGYRLLKSLIPSRVESLKPLPSDQVISLNNYGPTTCTLRWQREANGIPVADDGAVMDIDLASGRVLSYNLNWTSLPLPKAQGIISAGEALKAFEEAGMLQLQYVLPHSFKPLRNGQDRSPFLAYRLVDPSGGAIDAASGKPVVLAPGHYLREMGDGMGGAGGEQKAYASSLTPEELKEIEYRSRLMPQEKAEELVKNLIFPFLGEDAEHLTLRSANLEKDWQNPQTRVWTLNYSSSADENQGTIDLFVRLNAENGQLTSYYLSAPHKGTVLLCQDQGNGESCQGSISREEAKRAATDFLKKAAPLYLDQVKETPVSAFGLRPYNETNVDFAYQRMVNNIPCPENGINVSVDREYGIVTSFNLTWNEASFPSPQGVIGIDKAVEAYLKKAPLTLTYVTEWGPQGEQAVRLVYRPEDYEGQPPCFLVNAVTGAIVDTDGNPLKEGLKPFNFRDIEGVKGSQEIAILGQAGIMGEYGDRFCPAEKIRLNSLLRAMIACRNGAYSVQGLSDEEIAKQAKNMGIITALPAGNPVVTREMFCRLMVRYLGIDYLADRPSLFTTSYSDVPTGFRGYVTVVSGLNLLNPGGRKFGLKEPVTRAETAVALIRALTASSQ